MSIDAQKVKELEAFIATVDKNPALLGLPELAFFRSYLTKMGCTKIPKTESESSCNNTGCCPESPKQAPTTMVEEVEESDEEEPAPAEYESDGVDEEEFPRLKAESEPTPEMGPEGEKELSDEEMDKQNALKGEAQEKVEDGDIKGAIEKLTEAFKIGNVTAMMYSKRADFLLKCKRPSAAIKDCDAALKLNPDSSKAYRIRGIAERRLGLWEAAHKDLETAQKLDFDDLTEDHRKFVATKWKAMDKVRVAQRLYNERKSEKDRAKRVKKAQAERKKAAEAQRKREEKEAKNMGGGFPGGMPGGMGGKGKGKGGMPPGMGDLFSDPELMAAMSNPKVMTAFQEIMGNPAAFTKYQNDPEIMGIMEKLMGKMGGMGGMPGGMGGMPGMPGGMGGMPGMPGGMGGMPGMPGGMGGMPGMGGFGGGAPSGGGPTFSNVEECD